MKLLKQRIYNSTWIKTTNQMNSQQYQIDMVDRTGKSQFRIQSGIVYRIGRNRKATIYNSSPILNTRLQGMQSLEISRRVQEKKTTHSMVTS